MADTLYEMLKQRHTDMGNAARGATFVLGYCEDGYTCFFSHAEKAAPHLIGISENADLGDGIVHDHLPQLRVRPDKCAAAIAALSQHGSVSIVDRRVRKQGDFGPRFYLLAIVPQLPQAVPVHNDDDLI